MSCSKHPKFAGVRLGKKAKECPECVAFAAEVKAALPGGKEKRNRGEKKVKTTPSVDALKTTDPTPLGEPFSDPVEEEEVFEPADDDNLDEAL